MSETVDLVTVAKGFVATEMKKLTGGDDFMPFMLLNAPVGHIYAGLMMPEADDEKNRMADNMMALCVVHRPAEVMFVSTAWMILRKTKERLGDSLPVRKQADRQEAVFMVHHTGSTTMCDTYSAPVIRENNTVRLGEWTHTAKHEVTGRFGDAIRNGIFIAEQLPEEMAAWVDGEVEAGRGAEAGARVIRALNTFRQEASKN